VGYQTDLHNLNNISRLSNKEANMQMRSLTGKTVGTISWALVLGLLMLPGFARGYDFGPPDHRCGDPPDYFNCTECHDQFLVNSGPGSIDLTGLPTTYQPGAVYTFTVSNSQVGQRRWGFEITVIKSDGSRGGQLAVTNPDLMQLTANTTYNRDYLKHTTAGTFQGQPNGNSWQISWTAPAAGTGTVTFYQAGNCANGDTTNQGDYIYTISDSLPEEPNGVIGPVMAQPYTADLLTAYPNPFNPDVMLNLASRPGQTAQIQLVDVWGRLVEDFTVNTGEGLTRIPLHLETLPSGLYLARAFTPQGQAVVTLVKAK
jgi:hypothetical protein